MRKIVGPTLLLSAFLILGCAPQGAPQEIEFRVPVVAGEVGTGTVEDTVVRDTQPSAAGNFGRGIDLGAASGPASLVFRHGVVARNRDTGIFSIGATVLVEDTLVTDTLPQQSNLGRGAGIAAAIAAAAPPLEPPGTRVESHGLQVTPSDEFSVDPPIANSSMFVLPMMIPSLESNRSTTVELYGGLNSLSIREAQVVFSPFTHSRSLTATGSPASKPTS